MVTLIKTKQKPAWLNTVKSRLAALDPASDHAPPPSALDTFKDCDRDTARAAPPSARATSAPVLGILSFETARTMSRLISIHRSLADTEISTLRSSTLRSRGVAYLNSTDQPFLLRLACAELVEELDAAAAAVSRLSSGAGRCRVARQQVGGWAPEFRIQYAELKKGNAGRMVQHLAGTHRDVDKKVKKMATYVRATATLLEEMESLAEMEASERKLQRWRDYSGPMTPTNNNNNNPASDGSTTTAAASPAPPPPPPSAPNNPPGADLFLKRLAMQRKKVRRLQEESLWGKTHDKVVELMAAAVVAMFARICFIFSTVVPHLPFVSYDRDGRVRFTPSRHQQLLQAVQASYPHIMYPYTPYNVSSSGPLERNPPPPINLMSSSGPLFNGAGGGGPSAAAMMATGSSGPILRDRAADPFAQGKPWSARELEAPPNTVGGAGLALRYADVVDLAERMLLQPDCVGEDTREELYRMLPGALRAAVRQKLVGKMAKPSGAAGISDVNMAQGWRDAAGRILDWLAPMAHDTIRWHSDRSCERQKLDLPVSDQAEPRVLLLQTLYFSDRDKAEAAIVEVLVGLSCVCRYQYGACFQRDPASSADDVDDDDFFNLD